MSTKKRGLGKGLSALISDDIAYENIGSQEVVDYIDIGLITPNKNQPRVDFNDESLTSLADSIRVNGLIQPILVRKDGQKYEIIAGERRWRASKMAGLKEIPCLLKDVDEKASAKFALIENIQREDLNPIEEAIAYKKLMKDHKLTQEEVAREIGKSRPYIANTIRLLNLNREVIKYISNGELTAGHGKVLLGIENKEEQLKAANKIISDSLNIRESEKLTTKAKRQTKPKVKSTRDSNVVDLEESLMRILGTKVNLVIGNKKGKIEIEYYGYEDLERIIDILRGEKQWK
ncbi:MAG: ParB/RepB/Spo0J family partition protein [Tissierellaceae bacterium]|nr:ParB/RepB/Spo0J family partition protein [Tissierellaceae bacterium]